MTEQTTESIAAALSEAEAVPTPPTFLSAREVLTQLSTDPTVMILGPMLLPVLDAIDAANVATAKSKAVGGKLNKENKDHRQRVWESMADSNAEVKSDVDIWNQLQAQIEEVEKRLSSVALSNWPAEVNPEEVQKRREDAKALHDAAESLTTPNVGLFSALAVAMKNNGLTVPTDPTSLIPKLDSPSRVGKGAGKGTTRGPQKIRAEKVEIDGKVIETKLAGGSKSSSFGAIDVAAKKAVGFDLTSEEVHEAYLAVLNSAGYETDPEKRNQNEYPVYTRFYYRTERVAADGEKPIPVILKVEITRKSETYTGAEGKERLVQPLPDEMKATASEKQAAASAKK